MNSNDKQLRDNYNAENGVRGGGDQGCMYFGHYPGQIGVLVPNPSLGQTNFGGVTQNMPYGPFYVFPPFPFQQGSTQNQHHGQWQQQQGIQGPSMPHSNWHHGGGPC